MIRSYGAVSGWPSSLVWSYMLLVAVYLPSTCNMLSTSRSQEGKISMFLPKVCGFLQAIWFSPFIKCAAGIITSAQRN